MFTMPEVHLLVKIALSGTQMWEPLPFYLRAFGVPTEVDERTKICAIGSARIPMYVQRIGRATILSYFPIKIPFGGSKFIPLNSKILIGQSWKKLPNLLLELYATSDLLMSHILKRILRRSREYESYEITEYNDLMAVGAVLLLLEREIVSRDLWILHRVLSETKYSDVYSYYQLALRGKLIRLGLVGERGVSVLDLKSRKLTGKIIRRLAEIAVRY